MDRIIDNIINKINNKTIKSRRAKLNDFVITNTKTKLINNNKIQKNQTEYGPKKFMKP